MNLIDTHAHIYLDQFGADIEDIIGRSMEEGVEKIYMPNIDHTSIDGMLELEEQYPDLCIPMMGLHPCSVKKGFEKELYQVEDWLGKRDFVAVGEIGTDLYWDKTFWEEQKEAFHIQVKLAKQYEIPIIIHCRDSINETIELVEQHHDEKLTGIFHCFSGNLEQARHIMDLGFYLGFGGVTTFKNGGLDKVLPEITLEKAVLETDSPYLAPVPKRGKRNEPAYLQFIAEKIATLKNISVEEVASITTANAKRIFNMNASNEI